MLTDLKIALAYLTGFTNGHPVVLGISKSLINNLPVDVPVELFLYTDLPAAYGV